MLICRPKERNDNYDVMDEDTKKKGYVMFIAYLPKC